ncbi:MAG: DUF948 domain-containing protein [Candidatus Paceibacterota bacterium]|jgi:hypothetical protein
METILKSEIFFFISSISVVLITVIFIILGIYLIKIMINFSKISDSLRKTADGATASPLFKFFFGKKRKKRVRNNY